MDKREALRKELRAGSFVINNGIVMRNINVLRNKYIALRSVLQVSRRDMGEQEFLDCVNYLSQKGYIRLRYIRSKNPTELADAEYADLEAILTDVGIDLMGGAITNPMVDV